MGYSVNTTKDYYRSHLTTLGWELTVCNSLYPPESPCRSILKRSDSYGHLLYDYLNDHLPLEKIRIVMEIGGGYGYLMKDFLDRNASLRAAMLDISPSLLDRQRETLKGGNVTYIEADFLETDGGMLRGYDMAIMNENLGDFPTLLDLEQSFFSTPSTRLDAPLVRARHFLECYALPHPETHPFRLNIGALEALEKLCSAGIPIIFLGEHSCEAAVPESLRRLLSIRASGHPERISLKGHDEYTVQFSHLENVARALGYAVSRGAFADFLEIDFTEKLRSILAAPNSTKDEHEIIRQFVSDLFQYEYLILNTEGASLGGSATALGEVTCARCGKCCYTDFIAYTTDEDRKRWQREGRSDILAIIENEHATWAGDRLVSSDDGRNLRCCPFLTWDGALHSCAIYETRPAVCAHFVPGSSEICPQ